MIILNIVLLVEYYMFVFGVLEKYMELVKERAICLGPEHESIHSRVSEYLADILASIFIENKKTRPRSFIQNNTLWHRYIVDDTNKVYFTYTLAICCVPFWEECRNE